MRIANAKQWESATRWIDVIRCRKPRLHPRKTRLFYAAVCRQLVDKLPEHQLMPAVDALEFYADDSSDRTQIKLQRRICRDYIDAFVSARDPKDVLIDPKTNHVTYPDECNIAILATFESALDLGFDYYESFSRGFCESFQEDPSVSELKLVKAFREVHRNPFHVPLHISTPSTQSVSIGQSMYVSRDFSAITILADALEDAGCDDEHVLAHCRDPHAVHVRGCWVVDLVLGRS